MSFDGITVAYYAAICGALAALAPQLRTTPQRVLVGAGVGILAATLFPTVRGMMGM